MSESVNNDTGAEILRLAAEAGKAVEAANGAAQEVENLRLRIDAFEQRLATHENAVNAELIALGEGLEATVEAVAILAEEEEIKEEEKTPTEIAEEIQPPPAHEPEKRKRGWA